MNAYRRVIGRDRDPSTYEGAPARLVVRMGTVPHHSISYYWQSAAYKGGKVTWDDAKIKLAAEVEAKRNQPSLVIIDFGPPMVTSSKIGTVLLFTKPKKIPATTEEIKAAIEQYINYYMGMAMNYPNDQLILGVGTNNAGDLLCSQQTASTHSEKWALLIEDLKSYIYSQGYQNKIIVNAAMDFESWEGEGLLCGAVVVDPAPVENAIQWAETYSTLTDVPYIDFGIVDNLALGYGLTQWSADSYWYLSWGIPEANPLPEIYIPDGSNASDWQELARISSLCTGCMPEDKFYDPNWLKGRQMIFLGTLTQYGDFNCLDTTNTPAIGWKQLYQKLAVDVWTDQYPFKFVSDIAKSDGKTADGCTH